MAIAGENTMISSVPGEQGPQAVRAFLGRGVEDEAAAGRGSTVGGPTTRTRSSSGSSAVLGIGRDRAVAEPEQRVLGAAAGPSR